MPRGRDRDYLEVARRYEAGVRSGAIVACKWVKLACERNWRDRQKAEAGDPTFPYRFDESAAVKVCAAAELLPHIKGPKAKVVGRDDDGRAIWATLTLEPWQIWIFTTLFGWLQADEPVRRFRVGLILVARKNGKSVMGAVVELFMLTADGENGAECVSAATTRDQAKVVAEIVWEMARRSPQFREHYGVRMGAKTTRVVEVPETASKFMPLSADAHSLDGLNVSAAIVDELHAHKTRAVWDVLDTATGTRTQPLILGITTAGVDLGGICHEQMSYLHKVLEGTVTDDRYFGINYTLDDGDDWRDLEALKKSNPNYGVSVQPADIKRKIAAAEVSPAAIDNFRTKHGNTWVRTESAWMAMTEWIARGNRALRIEDFADAPCWIGVDLAEIRDIAAVVAIFRPDPNKYAWFGRYYWPEQSIAKSPIAQLSGWVKDGHLIATDGNQADFQKIEDDIVAWCDLLHDVREIDFDRALAAHMNQNLRKRFLPRMGRDAVEQFVITVPQTVETMNPAMTLVMSKTLSGQITHDGNPVNNWMFSNVVVERNYKDEVYPRKAGGKDSANKIDGPVAGFTAISRAQMATIAPKKPKRKAMVWTSEGMRPASGQEAHP